MTAAKARAPAPRASSPPARLPLIHAKDVQTRAMKWLWYPYLPDHAASLLYGPGGHGKSHITVDLAARISTGQEFPGEEGKRRRPPARVLMLSAEDELETILVPRLKAAGADLTQIAFPTELFTIDPMGLKRLERYIREWKPKFVVIDPIVHFMGGKVDMFRSNEVREVMGGLHQLAIRSEVVILIVGHTRKGSEGEDYEKAMGAADFMNSVRGALLVARNPDGMRVMRHTKSNYAPIGPSLPYAFTDGAMEWGEPFDEGGKASKPDPTGEKLGKERKRATSFIKMILKNGPIPAKEVEELAKDEGFNPRTLARAKNGVAESFAKRVDGKMVWIWKLIGDENGSERSEVSGVEEQRRPESQGPTDRGPVDGGVSPQKGDTGAATVPEVENGGRGGKRRVRSGEDLSRTGAVGSAFSAEIEALLKGVRQ